MKFWMRVTVVGLSLASFPLFAANEVVDAEVIRKKLGLGSYGTSMARLSELKVAILDNGFAGFDPSKKQGLLPQNAELIQLTQIGPSPTSHGLGMAQIVWALMGKKPEGPKFYLVNTNGFSNFKAAVQFVIDQKINLVLYSQVWPFGSNFDGSGFINAQVTRAVQSGVLWINAAGNHGRMVYNGFVERQRSAGSEFLFFGAGADRRDYLRFENKFDENEVSVTLSWTDFRESEEYNTTEDLDLYVYDDFGKLVGSSELIQRGEAPPAAGGDGKLSSHAREFITLRGLDRGSYRIQLRVRSNNFRVEDRFRVLMKAEKQVVFTDHSSGVEIQPPADHPLVLTVGEGTEDSSTGPTTDGRRKPEVVVEDARIAFTNGSQYRGSSTAAAFVAAAVALMKVEAPTLSLEKLRQYVSRLGSVGGNFPELEPADLSRVDSAALRYLPSDGRLMQHRFQRRLVILTPGDPFALPGPRSVGIRRILADDILVVSPYQNQWYSIPKSMEEKLQVPMIEFRQGGVSSSVATPAWRTPSLSELRAM